MSLCRLAQNGFPGLGAWPFPCKFSYKNWLLWHLHVHFDGTDSRKKSAARSSWIFVCGIVLENFRIKWLLWHVHAHFVWAGLHKTVVAVLGVTFSWKFLHKTARGFCQMSTMHFDFAGLHTTAVPVLGPVLPQTVWPLGAPSGFRLFSCKFSQKLALVWCPCESISTLQNRTNSATRVLLEVLHDLGLRHFTWRSLIKNMFFSDMSMMSMCMSIAQASTKRLSRSWGAAFFLWILTNERALVEILLNSCLRGPCMILYRSLTEDFVEILMRSSLRGPCMKILQMPCLYRGACMKAFVGGSGRHLGGSCLKIL